MDQRARLDAVRAASMDLNGALDLADELAAMLRQTTNRSLSEWLVNAEGSDFVVMRGFARSLRWDQEAVAAAMKEKWSNGPVEGYVNRLKAIKRQMFGRAGFQLLRARVLHAA